MLQLPYGKTYLPFDETGAQTLLSRVDELRSGAPGDEIVRRAIDAPIGSPHLAELAAGKRTCTVIVSDHTRPVPSRDILPEILRRLETGSPGIRITLLVATGCHRASAAAELRDKLGADILARYPVVMHDARDAAANVEIGTLPSGAPLVVNRAAVETDLLVAEGFIEPHFFAGFSGGRKSVLPGVCDQRTVFGNHCSRFIDSPYARTGVLDGNPIQTDMLAAARISKLAFIVNVVIDDAHRTVAAFAGDCAEAHTAGCAFLSEYCAVRPASAADIVVTTNGGAPLDQNLYQCVKGMTAAESAARDGGTIILAAECADGVGGDRFYHDLADAPSAAALYASILAVPQGETRQDQWQSQILARVLAHHRVIMVTRPEMAPSVRAMKMAYAPTLDDAMACARETHGAGASLTVIPNGVSVMVSPPEHA